MNNKTKKMNSSSSSGSGMIPEKRWILVGDEEEIIVSSSPRKRWKVNEEMALLNGIKKHGPGRWKTILNDQQFSPFLLHRSNVSLKDKWRNLTRLNKSSRYERPQSSANKKTDPRHKAPRDKSDGVGNNKNESGNSEKINSVGQSSHGDNQKKHNKERLEDYASFAACMIKEAGNVTREAAEACKGIENLKKIAEEIKELVKLAD